MYYPIGSENQKRIDTFQEKLSTQLVTILFADLAGSTQIKSKLGDQSGFGLIKNHHQVVRTLLTTFENAQEIGTLGESFLIIFISASDAVRFALILQRRLKSMSLAVPLSIVDRIGIHMGEVIFERHEHDNHLQSIHGISVDLCSQIMSLAGAGQILMTQIVFDNARQALKGQDIEGISEIAWMNYGPFNFKGIEDRQIICEVGEVGFAPLTSPDLTEVIHRPQFQHIEPVLGWRPAIGLVVPKTQWVLGKKIGEGGFGEVWLAQHKTLKEHKAFKFCFLTDRVRSLKREAVLFRILKESFGDHPYIVPLHEVNFENPPYYIIMDYIPNKDLKHWFEGEGKFVPLEIRLEIIAQVAEALQAAHNAGIIHRDIKPSNILIQDDPIDRTNIKIKLTDFGIGQVLSKEIIHDLTSLGLSHGIVSEGQGSLTGTPMYMSPALLAGERASISSDLYSLGIVLYQLIIGDMTKPLTTDWHKLVPDPLLQEDLKGCFSSEDSQRFSSAIELAKNLRQITVRRQRMESEFRSQQAMRRRKTAGKIIVIILIILSLLSAALFIGITNAINEKEKAMEAKQQVQIALDKQIKAQQETRQAQIITQDALARAQNAEALATQALDKVKDTLSLNDFILAEQLLKKGKKAEAVAYLSRSLRNNPNNQSVLYLLFSTLTWHGFPKLMNEFYAGYILDSQMRDTSTQCVIFNQDGKILWFDPSLSRVIEEKYLVMDARIYRGRLIDDLSQAVTVNLYNEAHLWDIESGNILMAPVSFKSFVDAISFDSSGTKIAVASQNTVAVWDLKKRLPIADAFLHDSAIQFVVLSPQANLLYTFTEMRSVYLWDIPHGKLLFTHPNYQGNISSAVISSDETKLIIAYDRNISSFTLPHGTLEHNIITPWESVNLLSLHADGNRLAACSNHGDVLIWELPNYASQVAQLSQSQTINYLAFGSHDDQLITGLASGITTIWEIPLHLGLKPTINHPYKPLTILKQNNKFILAVLSADGNDLELIDAKTGAPATQNFIHHPGMRIAAVSPNGEWLATSGNQHTVKLWKMKSRRESPIIINHEDQITAIAFSGDSQYLATGSWDKSVKIWDLNNQTMKYSPLIHPLAIKFMSFSPDGKHLVTGCGDNHARLWPLTSDPISPRSLEHDEPLSAAVFSAAGNLIATASTDHKVKIWQTDQGTIIGNPLQLDDIVDVITFNPTGEAIATGTHTGMVQLWDIRTGQPLTLPLRHNDQITEIFFNHDGTQVLTCSNDHRVKIWDMGLGVDTDSAWLCDFAEVFAGLRITEQSTLERMNQGKRSDIIAKIEKKQGSDLQIHWARWLCSENGKRFATPFANFNKSHSNLR